jgi:hypothetical protein
MDKFILLSSLCKFGVQISVNDHRGSYDSVESFIPDEERKEIEDDVFDAF